MTKEKFVESSNTTLELCFPLDDSRHFLIAWESLTLLLLELLIPVKKGKPIKDNKGETNAEKDHQKSKMKLDKGGNCKNEEFKEEG